MLFSRNLGISRAPLKSQAHQDTIAPAYSRALRWIKGVVQRVVHGKLRSDYSVVLFWQRVTYCDLVLDAEH